MYTIYVKFDCHKNKREDFINKVKENKVEIFTFVNE